MPLDLREKNLPQDRQERLPDRETTLTPALSRSTGRGGRQTKEAADLIGGFPACTGVVVAAA
jgi:hypothetical protein